MKNCEWCGKEFGESKSDPYCSKKCAHDDPDFQEKPPVEELNDDPDFQEKTPVEELNDDPDFQEKPPVEELNDDPDFQEKPPVEELKFDVELVSFAPESKVEIIKIVCEVIVEDSPSILKRGISKEKAEEIKSLLEAAGAKALIKENVPEFDVELVSFAPESKVKVIKIVRNVACVGLKEAKDLVESSPSILKRGISKEKAEEIKSLLEAVGAKVLIKEKAPVEELKFDVELVSFAPESKVEIIKIVCEVIEEDLVEDSPSILKRGISKEKAEKIKSLLEAVGAKVLITETVEVDKEEEGSLLLSCGVLLLCLCLLWVCFGFLSDSCSGSVESENLVAKIKLTETAQDEVSGLVNALNEKGQPVADASWPSWAVGMETDMKFKNIEYNGKALDDYDVVVRSAVFRKLLVQQNIVKEIPYVPLATRRVNGCEMKIYAAYQVEPIEFINKGLFSYGKVQKQYIGAFYTMKNTRDIKGLCSGIVLEKWDPSTGDNLTTTGVLLDALRIIGSHGLDPGEIICDFKPLEIRDVSKKIQPKYYFDTRLSDEDNNEWQWSENSHKAYVNVGGIFSGRGSSGDDVQVISRYAFSFIDSLQIFSEDSPYCKFVKGEVRGVTPPQITGEGGKMKRVEVSEDEFDQLNHIWQ